MSVNKNEEVSAPLKKNQVYNWFDRYKTTEETRVYTLTHNAYTKPSLVKRFIKLKSVL
jgi:hypothetical protein